MIETRYSEDHSMVSLSREGCEEFFVTAENPETAMRVVKDAGASIVSQDVFGLTCGPVNWPMTLVNTGLKGSQIWAVKGVAVEPIVYQGRVVGSIWEDGFAKYCRLGGLYPFVKNDADPAEQTTKIFDVMETALGEARMNFSHVARTWFYLNEILKWYDDFNQARDVFFRARKVFDGLVPASTGMGGSNPEGAALTAGLLAVEPLDDTARIRAVPSPLQCPALEYGSTFSRAVEIATADLKRVLVSGTASIDVSGATVHTDDPETQIEWTMKVVEAILDSCGMTWKDATRAVAYFKKPAFSGLFDRLLRDGDLPRIPIVHVINDVCRDDLLFEIEVDAISSR